MDYTKALRENDFLHIIKNLYVGRVMDINLKQQFTKIFNEYDLDNSGSLDRKEFKLAI